MILLVTAVLFVSMFSQDSSQDLHLFDTTSSSGTTLSTSSLFPGALSATVAPDTTAKSSTTASSLSFPGPVFSTSPVSIETVSTKPVIFPQPNSSLLTSLAPAALSQSFSMALPAPSAALVTPKQVSTSQGALQSPSASLSHNLQDLALLDLGSPKMWVVYHEVKIGKDYHLFVIHNIKFCIMYIFQTE